MFKETTLLFNNFKQLQFHSRWIQTAERLILLSNVELNGRESQKRSEIIFRNFQSDKKILNENYAISQKCQIKLDYLFSGQIKKLKLQVECNKK